MMTPRGRQNGRGQFVISFIGIGRRGGAPEQFGWKSAMRGISKGFIWAVAATLAVAAAPARSQETTTFQPQCIIANLDNLPHAICEFGPLVGGRIVHVQASKEGVGAPQEANFLAFTTVGKTSAVYYLLDRSTRRVKTFGPSVADAARLLEAARLSGPNDRFGFGAFSDKLDTLAQIGASREEVLRAIAAVKPDAQTSDLYKLGADALRLLALAQAERRVLMVASDGHTDGASTREELLRAAREAKAVVVALAYREKPDQPELPAFRKLAEDTGGVYFEVNAQTGRFDEETVARLSQYLGSGGTATFQLDKSAPRGRYQLLIQFENGTTATGIVQADVIPLPTGDGKPGPVKPGDGQAGTPGKPTGDGPALTPVKDPAETAEKSPYVIGAIIAVVLGALGFGAWFVLARPKSQKPLAYVDAMDGAGRRPIVSAATRIGRHSDNDLRFVNDSVHRHHAVIAREADGNFTITDVSKNRANSNGVVVNGVFVEKHRLNDGDLVELGEVRFRFYYA